MLVNTARLTDAAKAGGYAVPGFCPMDLEQLSWCFEVSRQHHSPMIVCGGASGGYTLEEWAGFVKYYSDRYPDVPAALCLDHGPTYEQCARAIRAGFTSVMIDMSMYDKESNIRVSKEVVDLAHLCDVGVETSIGGTTWRDPTPEEILAHMTTVEDVQDLVNGTGCDMVAVYVGNCHGDANQKHETVLHYDLIEALRDCSPAALVMHGSSNTGDDKLAQAARCGVAKFNAAGDMLIGGVEAYGEVKDTEDGGEAFDALKRGFMKRASDYIVFFGAENKG